MKSNDAHLALFGLVVAGLSGLIMGLALGVSLCGP